MPISNWKIIGASAIVAGLGVGVAVSATTDSAGTPDRIELRDVKRISAPPPDRASGLGMVVVDPALRSGVNGSFATPTPPPVAAAPANPGDAPGASPFDTVDSPDFAPTPDPAPLDSVDTPDSAPTPDPAPFESANSVDTPDPAPAPTTVLSADTPDLGVDTPADFDTP